MPGLCPRAWHSQSGRGVITGWGQEWRVLTLADDTVAGTGYQGMDGGAWQEGTLKGRSGWILEREADPGFSLSLVWEHRLIRTLGYEI